MGQRFRAAGMADLPVILEILSQGREFLRRQGVNQWQDADGYPNPDTVKADIARGECFLWEENGIVLATAVCSLREEEAYRRIQGAWKTQGPYGVIHRAASAANARRTGVMSRLMGVLIGFVWEKGLCSVRIDTHEDNLPMRSFLQRMGFLACGVIRLSTGAPRVAYELPLSKARGRHLSEAPGLW